MFGAGFIRDMINSSKGNRSLLKGNESAAYKNFDTSTYKVRHTNKTARYKDASPELLDGIKSYNQQAKRSRIKAMLISLVLSIAILLGLARLFLFLFT